MEKLEVKKELCVGCGMCVSQNPEYFEFDDEGLSSVKKEDVNSSDKNSLLESIELCPTEAILINEEKTE